jgi:hypothetical protein
VRSPACCRRPIVRVAHAAPMRFNFSGGCGLGPCGPLPLPRALSFAPSPLAASHGRMDSCLVLRCALEIATARRNAEVCGAHGRNCCRGRAHSLAQHHISCSGVQRHWSVAKRRVYRTRWGDQRPEIQEEGAGGDTNRQSLLASSRHAPASIGIRVERPQGMSWDIVRTMFGRKSAGLSADGRGHGTCLHAVPQQQRFSLLGPSFTLQAPASPPVGHAEALFSSLSGRKAGPLLTRSCGGPVKKPFFHPGKPISAAGFRPEGANSFRR